MGEFPAKIIGSFPCTVRPNLKVFYNLGVLLYFDILIKIGVGNVALPSPNALLVHCSSHFPLTTSGEGGISGPPGWGLSNEPTTRPCKKSLLRKQIPQSLGN